MYVITGITGQVGGTVARTLLAAGKNVRAVVRDASRGGEWLRQGCELALADMRDAAALTRAFKGAEAVFVLLPPNFDPSPDFLESRYIVSTLRSALETAQPAKVVCLSTIGAQASQSNLLRQLSDMEQQLGQLPMPVAFLRAGWFMENSLWDIAPARDEGVLHSFLQPLDKAVPMSAAPPPCSCRSPGRAYASSSWKGRGVSRHNTWPLLSGDCWVVTCRHAAYRVTPGSSFSAARACTTHCHACRCSMDSIKAGSTSQARRYTAPPNWKRYSPT